MRKIDPTFLRRTFVFPSFLRLREEGISFKEVVHSKKHIYNLPTTIESEGLWKISGPIQFRRSLFSIFSPAFRSVLVKLTEIMLVACQSPRNLIVYRGNFFRGNVRCQGNTVKEKREEWGEVAVVGRDVKGHDRCYWKKDIQEFLFLSIRQLFRQHL